MKFLMWNCHKIFIIMTTISRIGTDEARLIKEITGHNNAQRQLIKQQYLTLYGKVFFEIFLFKLIWKWFNFDANISKKTLEEDIKSEISGKFLTGVLALLTVNTRQFYIFFKEQFFV